MRTSDLRAIEESKEAFVLAEDVGRLMGVSPMHLRIQARTKPELLGFPVIVVGNQLRIPRIPFLNFIKGSSQVFELKEEDPEDE